MTDARASAPSPARLAGLDGLRAVAVALVVAYHLFPDWWLHSGFIGVDVFFVISGFLITMLLLDESATGRIRLVPFWQRRARRLLPALALLVTVCATAAWVVGGDVLVKMGAQILGAATFSYNWVSIAGGAGYFGGDTPELFRNLWSLAVEEQFYVLWPLVLPLFLLLGRPWVRGLVATVAAAGSAVWMGVLVQGAADPTRAYFGTDSHSFGILLGVALAFVLHGALRSPRAWMSRPALRAASLVAGIAAVAAIVLVAAVVPVDGVATFPGTLLAASLLTALAITAGVWPGSWFGRAIDVAPLTWIGDRSYGIYLWHWPLLVLIVAWAEGTAPAGGVPLGLGLVTLAATLVIAEISYRAIETPVRRHGFRGSLALLGRRLSGSPATRFSALAGLAAGVIVLGGTSAAIAAAPAVTSAEAAVAAGQDALDTASATPPAPSRSAETPAATPTVGTTTAPATPAPTASAPSTGLPMIDASPTPSPTPVTGSEVTAVGDSVMLASAKGLLDALPGIYVDAKVSRSMWSAPAILEKLERAGKLRPYVVIALGTNGPVDTKPLRQIMQIAGPDRQVIFVNAYAPRSWIPGVNRALAKFAASYPNATVADWSKAISGQQKLLAGDHIHPGAAGGRVFAATVGAALDRVEAQRAQLVYQRELQRYRDERGLNANIR